MAVRGNAFGVQPRVTSEEARTLIAGIEHMGQGRNSAAELTSWGIEARKAERVVLAHINTLRGMGGRMTRQNTCEAIADELNAALNRAMERFAMQYDWYDGEGYEGRALLGYEGTQDGGYTRHECECKAELDEDGWTAAIMVAGGSVCPDQRHGCDFVAPMQRQFWRDL